MAVVRFKRDWYARLRRACTATSKARLRRAYRGVRLMKYFPVAFLLVLVLSGLSAPAYAVPPLLRGDWIGQIDFGKSWHRINFHFTDENEEGKATPLFPAPVRTPFPP